MKIREGLPLRKIGKEYVILKRNESGEIDFSTPISLNEVAGDLLEYSKDKTFEEKDWVDYLVENYEVTPEQAAVDVTSFLSGLKEQGIIVD